MLKLAIDPIPAAFFINFMFASVWVTGKVPSAWKEGIG